VVITSVFKPLKQRIHQIWAVNSSADIIIKRRKSDVLASNLEWKITLVLPFTIHLLHYGLALLVY
jgi:hypothetical protein